MVRPPSPPTSPPRLTPPARLLATTLMYAITVIDLRPKNRTDEVLRGNKQEIVKLHTQHEKMKKKTIRHRRGCHSLGESLKLSGTLPIDLHKCSRVTSGVAVRTRLVSSITDPGQVETSFLVA